MKLLVESEQETIQEGLEALMKNLPPSKVARLLSIWQVGRGNYTNDRRKLFAGESVDSLFAKARALDKRGKP